MITFTTQLHVAGCKAKSIFEFLLNATDGDFQAWWPGIHLRYHTLKRYPDHVGNVMYLDQYIGDYRVRATEVIVEAVAHCKIVRQVVQAWFRLPVRITYEFADDDRGVSITHTIHAGFSGPGRLLDPAFRLYFSQRFMAAMDKHLVDEFELLRNMAIMTTTGARA